MALIAQNKAQGWIEEQDKEFMVLTWSPSSKYPTEATAIRAGLFESMPGVSSTVWVFFCLNSADLTNLLIARFSGCVQVLLNYKSSWTPAPQD